MADLFLESKHADVVLTRGDDWSLWFFNAPQEGKCLSVECIPENWPRVTVMVVSREHAKECIENAKRELGFAEPECKF